MFAAKPIASLSSGLLARKGGARPAMRPTTLPPVITPESTDDLGWNDMGAEPAPVLPPVLVERAALRDEIEAPVPAAEKPPVARVRPGARGKAAFTLRLEPARHLRLRLASAVRHRSAQQLVTDALDAFLNSLPDVEELARQCPTPDRFGD